MVGLYGLIAVSIMALILTETKRSRAAMVVANERNDKSKEERTEELANGKALRKN